MIYKSWIDIRSYGPTGIKVYMGVSDSEPSFLTMILDSDKCVAHWKTKNTNPGEFSVLYSQLMYAGSLISSFWEAGLIDNANDIESVFFSCRKHFTADNMPYIYNSKGKCISHCHLTSDGKELDMPT